MCLIDAIPTAVPTNPFRIRLANIIRVRQRSGAFSAIPIVDSSRITIRGCPQAMTQA